MDQSRLRYADPIGCATRPATSLAAMKALQCRKIQTFKNALFEAGVVTLDAQAKALGLCRSTAWTVLRGSHKGSGLSASLIHRMLGHAGLPNTVRNVLVQYTMEKAAGAYGHSLAQRRRFAAQLFELVPGLSRLADDDGKLCDLTNYDARSALIDA
jgi:hypothetical protein